MAPRVTPQVVEYALLVDLRVTTVRSGGTVSQNSVTRSIERQLVFGRVSRHSTIR